jgi:hypothetical protein
MIKEQPIRTVVLAERLVGLAIDTLARVKDPANRIEAEIEVLLCMDLLERLRRARRELD